MAYSDEVLADSPLAYYRLEESGASNPTDSSGNNITASLNGGYTWGATGAVGTALLLNGTNSYFTMTRQSITASRSYVAWVKTTSTDATNAYAGNAALTVIGDGTASVWESFGVHNGKARYTRFNGSAWQTFNSSTSVNDGNWHMIAVTYNSSTRAVVIYVDGSADGAGGTMTTHNAQGGFNTVGRGFNNGDYFDGTLDEVEMHTSVLSAARISARYTAATAGASHALTGALTVSVTLTGDIVIVHPLSGALTVGVTAEAARLTMAQPLTGALSTSVTVAGSLVAPAGSTALTGALTVSVSASATTLRIQLPGPYTSTGWNTTSGSTTITGGTASASDVGALVTGPGIPAGTRIVSVTP